MNKAKSEGDRTVIKSRVVVRARPEREVNGGAQLVVGMARAALGTTRTSEDAQAMSASRQTSDIQRLPRQYINWPSVQDMPWSNVKEPAGT
jgi:cytosine/adenosine deaminase-related metal-dependent hydrolase